MSSQQYQRLFDDDRDYSAAHGDDGHGTSGGGHGGDDSNVLDNIVDLKQINARLQDWFVKIKLKQSQAHKDFDRFNEEIHSSVFTPTLPHVLSDDEYNARSTLSREQFTNVVDSVRQAISANIQPRLVTKGSSGSYFAVNKRGKVVGIFKPKNEEPYGQLNPKWTKWLHRNLFPCFFGRSCLIPNLSYISEAGAYLLDQQLRTNIVPPTDIVWFASPSFNYDYFDRRAHYSRGKPLPPKQGSFQVFLDGFKDATEFLKEHPWPDAAPRPATDGQQRSWASCVGSSFDNGSGEQDEDALDRLNAEITTSSPAGATNFWSAELMQSMREELEKLVILDYIMRNTDRGLDNWMLKVAPRGPDGKSRVEIAAASSSTASSSLDVGSAARDGGRGAERSARASPSPPSTSDSVLPEGFTHEIQLGAIDNSLAFPWKHPDEWRSFPFGWLFLPASLVGQPFSVKTRQHFLPLLTDPKWWRETTSRLKALFSQDSDYQERMFAKQMAVLKGQAWNVVETLKQGDQGPLELARRPRLHVWTDIMEVPVTVAGQRRQQQQQQQQQQAQPMQMGVTSASASATPKKATKRNNGIVFDAEEIDLGVVPEEDVLRAKAGQGGRKSSRTGLVSGSLPNETDYYMRRSMDAAGGSGTGSGRSAWANDGGDLAAGASTSPSRSPTLSPTSARRTQQQSSSSGKQSIPSFQRSRTSLDYKSATHRSPMAAGGGGGGRRGRGMSLLGAQADAAAGGNEWRYYYDEESDLGDLGYGLAREEETSTRRVVVERLETVHGAEAVFSWC